MAEPAVVGDVIESPPRSRRPLAAVLTAVAVVVVVLLGGGAFALARMWNGPVGTLPEDLVPGSVAAFARIDLAPGIGQRVKVEALLRKAGGGSKSFDDTKRDIFADLGAPIRYDDVASWFDDRAGVALWADPDRDGKAVTLAVLSSRDDKKARTALDAAQRRAGTDSIGFVAGDGSVLLAFGGKDLQRVATAAAAAAKKAPLSKEPAFTSAVAKLPAGQPGLAWADLARATVLQQAVVATALEEEDLGDEAGPIPLPDVKGTLVVGVQAADDGIEIRARVSGAAGLPLTGAATGTDALAQLGALAADATAAGVAAGPLGDLTVLGGSEFLLTSSLFPLVFLGGAVTPGDVELDAPPPGFDPDTAIELPPDVDPTDPESLHKYLEEHPEVLAGGTVRRILPPGAATAGTEALRKGSEALTKALTGAASVSFTVAGPAGPDDAPGGPLLIDLRLADAATAKQLQTDLAGLLKAGGTVCEVREEHVILRTKTYAAGKGTLADSPRFKAATTGGVPGATAAFYLDGERGDAAPAKAVGVTVGRDGTDTVVMARILIG
ncbi:hypothetical protein OHA72_00390 [Dactylosporangium sp. NBC_01737]|uniref:hypothetical protein n=1 Tax=Dactylosporangium sp. NBC_01737 TaxID=2975959 RepID=UPI002E0E54E2|nr:hypothetical protein OHA72_00390 [Dactylosporangium sp. NBC_01737]